MRQQRNTRDEIGCEEFRTRHSEFIDGVLDEADHRAWQRHVGSCLPCARHDRTVRRSCSLLHSLPPIETSCDFYPRLQHRIFHIDDDDRSGRQGSGGHVAVSLAIAGVMAAVAWSPAFRPQHITVDLPAVQAQAPPQLQETRSVGPILRAGPVLSQSGRGLASRPAALAAEFAHIWLDDSRHVVNLGSGGALRQSGSHGFLAGEAYTPVFLEHRHTQSGAAEATGERQATSPRD